MADRTKNIVLNKDNVILPALLLVLMSAVIYLQLAEHEFLNFDTYSYVSENPHVKNGITIDNIIWAFTSTYKSNWHPLTWLSHMLDVELFGLKAGAHHLVNLAFHIINVLLLFYFLYRATLLVWPSFLVAALFAIHPLHVESVAWVAERKDVLSSCFWMLAMISYMHYVRRPNITRYLAVFILLSMGLMAKPMLVTLPFVLLLMDYWPLMRWRLCSEYPEKTATINLKRVVWEKVPLLIPVVISCVVTFYAQHEWGSVLPTEKLSIADRSANALAAYLAYLVKTFYPMKLAIFYPLRDISNSEVITAGLFIVFVSLMAIRWYKSRPWLIVGWLWYLGTLIPVIGLVQVGSQSMADRYTYIPLIGIFLILVWSGVDLANRYKLIRKIGPVFCLVILLVLGGISMRQVRFWGTNIELYEHALVAAENNHLAHYNLGISLSNVGRLDEAEPHLIEAARMLPVSELYYYGWGMNLLRQGRLEQAQEKYEKSLELDKHNWFAHELHHYLGITNALKGNTAEAERHFRKSLEYKPDFADAYYGLGNLIMRQGRLREARLYFEKSLAIEPENVDSLCGMGEVLALEGKKKEAENYLVKALRAMPDNAYIRERVEHIRGKFRTN